MGILWGSRKAALPAAPARRNGDPMALSDYFRLWAGGGTYADVNASTPLVAMQSIAVRSSIDLLASLCSELPFSVYAPASTPGGRKTLKTTPGYMDDPSGDGMGVEDWRYQVVVSWLTRGNAFGEWADFRQNYPTQCMLWNPDSVSGFDVNGVNHWSHAGKEITDMSTFMHRRVNPVPGYALGLSPIRQHADSIGISIAASRFGLQWFKDGAHPGGILSNSLVDLAGGDKIKEAKDAFMAAVYGTREPLVLGRGWDYKAIQVNAEESQFLATSGASEAQCCRIFGPGVAETLGYESGGSMTYSTVESRAVDLLRYNVNKWLRRLDRLQSFMLPRPWKVETDRDALLQSTTLERYQAYHAALVDGWRTINEVRTQDENLDPVAWGDKPFTMKAATPAKAPNGDDDSEDPTKEGSNDA